MQNNEIQLRQDKVNFLIAKEFIKLIRSFLASERRSRQSSFRAALGSEQTTRTYRPSPLFSLAQITIATCIATCICCAIDKIFLPF